MRANVPPGRPAGASRTSNYLTSYGQRIHLSRQSPRGQSAQQSRLLKETARQAVEDLKSAAQAKATEFRSAAEAKANEFRSAAEAKANEFRQAAEAKAHEYKEKAGEYYTDARAKAEEYYGQARERARTLQDDGEVYVRENPLRALGIAAAAGFVLGLMFRK